MKIYEGNLVPKSVKIAIIVTRFNEFITSKLLAGAMDALKRHEVSEEDIEIVVICLGAVIRGATTHYDYVCSEVSKGIASVSLKTGVPVMFGILTTENIEQAIERAGTKAGNKGYDCAIGAIEMINLVNQIEAK